MKHVITAIWLSLGMCQAAPLSVYFGTGGGASKGIYRATFDPESGKLSEAILAAEVRSPGFLALHPDGQKLYAVAQVDGQGAVAGYEILDDGALRLINSAPIGDGGGTHIAVHPSSHFLLTAQYGGGSVALLPLEADGKLKKSSIHKHEGGAKVVEDRQNSPHPHWCGFSPDGRFAMVPDLGLDGIVIYKVDAETPTISRHGFAASVPGGGPRHMRFSVDGKFIYLLNELASSVTTFSYEATSGTATRLGTTQALTKETMAKEAFNSAAEILTHPNGRFVYSSNRGNDSVTAFRADPKTGALTVTEVEPIRGAWPRNIALDPNGHWLLAAGADSNTVAVHRIDASDGALQYQTKGIITVPSPICILFVPNVAN